MVEVSLSGKVMVFTGNLTRFDNFSRAVLPAYNEKEVSFDVANLHVDTAGLAWLIKQKINLAESGIQIHWLHASQELMKLATINNVLDILGIE